MGFLDRFVPQVTSSTSNVPSTRITAQVAPAVFDAPYGQLYGNYGYINYAPVPNQDFDEAKKEVNLVINVDEDRQFYVNRINFNGNTTNYTYNARGLEESRREHRPGVALRDEWQRLHRVVDLLPVDQDDGENGPGLDGDVEHLGLVIVKSQQGPRQNQVAGGRDGQKLGQALDHPQN